MKPYNNTMVYRQLLILLPGAGIFLRYGIREGDQATAQEK
jgi:hypothetical protein